MTTFWLAVGVACVSGATIAAMDANLGLFICLTMVGSIAFTLLIETARAGD